jgi:hypothetical protein
MVVMVVSSDAKKLTTHVPPSRLDSARTVLNFSSSEANMAAIKAVSFERYNGGIAIKRQYGSATITKFFVFRAEDENDASKYLVVKGYGRTPGDRKTDAIRRSGLQA